MAFTRHATIADLGGPLTIKRLVRAADIVVPEAFGWTPEVLEALTRVSKGDTDVYVGLKKSMAGQEDGEYSIALLDSIFASFRKIQIVDIPAGHAAVASIRALEHAPMLKPTYEETLAAVDERLRQGGLLQSQREAHILRRLGPALAAIIDPHPKLRAKKPVQVLMLMGVEHIFMHNVLTAAIQPAESGLPRAEVVVLGSTAYPLQENTIKNFHKGHVALTQTEHRRLLAESMVKSIMRTINIVSRIGADPLGFAEFVQTLSDGELQAVYESTDPVRLGFDPGTPIMQKLLRFMHSSQTTQI